MRKRFSNQSYYVFLKKWEIGQGYKQKDWLGVCIRLYKILNIFINLSEILGLFFGDGEQKGLELGNIRDIESRGYYIKNRGIIKKNILYIER